MLVTQPSHPFSALQSHLSPSLPAFLFPAISQIQSHQMAGKRLTPNHHPRRKPPPPSPSTTTASKSRPPKPVRTTTTARPPSEERSHHSGRQYNSPVVKFAYPESRTSVQSPNSIIATYSTTTSPRPTTLANKHYVFVYGTLKTGFANAHLLERATFLGDFRTVMRYPLVVGGKYNSPYLLDMPSKGSRVKGEVYAVDDATLADLDHLENVGVNYSRKVAKVANCSDRSFMAHAYVYLKTNGLEQLAKNRFLDDYQCRKYVPRHLRNDSVPASATRKTAVAFSGPAASSHL